MRDVAVLGVGYTAYTSQTPEVNWKELMYEAAVKAYADAQIDPRRDVDSFITCAEDFWEGFSIFDEFTPDQLGAALRPMMTVTGDGLLGLANAYMQIKTGLFNIVVVEAHSKISELLTYEHVLEMAYDPVYERPLSAERNVHPHYVAGLEMNLYLHATGTTEEQCAFVAVQNRRQALNNPLAPYGARIGLQEIFRSGYAFTPLKKWEIASRADGSIVFVLAAGEIARRLTKKPLVYLEGIGWSSESPWIAARSADAGYARRAAQMAYRQAGITDPRSQIDVIEVEDRFAFKELQHLEALGFARPGEAGWLAQSGALGVDGELKVNLSGGSLGCGDLVEASALQRALEIVLQLRGEAGARQVPNARVGVAQSWRGLPHGTGAVAVFARRD
ncbi:MAG: acetyl-CoA acetyltransferase [Candidatus Bipolaricaulota bacterium]|nr:acetyl-CoA acetyltransferase [Candidatus Bipolaricaulota bacterium]